MNAIAPQTNRLIMLDMKSSICYWNGGGLAV